ncbi:peptidylprolyl isomerase [uncultured Prochlorococcus sp.]|uniref:peptidylprolyl isomerase n=1 Tax=uncultured Prochlorococcus sp. TaxID=159733 RepID=UPI00258A19C6|nr:peptidylprolyl isomerase [uncultured Prochlorococcus sp.]
MVQACSYKSKIDPNYYCQKLKFSCIKSNKVVNFKTSKGDFVVKLFGKDNPVTVSNFLENIENNIYVNQKFYKIINYPQIRFIHGGVNPENKSYKERIQNLNKTSPTIPLEIKFIEEVKPRYNYQIKNPSETVNLVNTFESGSIAMVKSGKDKSSSTEFFFVTTKIPELDGRYSIFGKIIKGLDVLEKINKEDYIKEVQISN